MIEKYRQLIGVDVGRCVLKTYNFIMNDNKHFERDFGFSSPLTPGALTVLACEAVDLIDKESSVDFISLAFPGEIDHKRRKIQSCSVWAGWDEVPLADWLEIRLKRKVVIFKKKSFALIEDVSIFFL
ncbi:hypothetical protein [Prochlorococcus marinus]|uniref:hypothetical protein n=1 Tax=Prochlorococcus marinus TaxID=1219 RepID=UPI0022B49F3A|nr:hypothetical protein [Prochlorococcus marinus]